MTDNPAVAVGTDDKPSIVFAHGLWADGSCFSKVIGELQAEGYEAISSQFGLASAPMVPHFVHAIFGPNEGTVTSPGRWSTFMISSCRHW